MRKTSVEHAEGPWAPGWEKHDKGRGISFMDLLNDPERPYHQHGERTRTALRLAQSKPSLTWCTNIPGRGSCGCGPILNLSPPVCLASSALEPKVFFPSGRG